MLRLRWMYLIIVLTTIGWLAADKPARSQSTVTVAIAPGTAQVAIGQTVEVAVEIVDVEALYGFDIALTFNPNVVEVVDADPGQAGVQMALGTFLDSGFVVLNAADNVTGTVRFAMTQLNPSLPKSGTGALMVIRLRGKQVSGSTPLTLTHAQLARRDGTSLSTNLISGQVSVVAAAGIAPTGTPIPTQGPGTLIPTSTPPSVPATGSATVPPTLRPLVTRLSATITPRPTDQPAMTAPAASTQNSSAPSAASPLPSGASATPEHTSEQSAPAATRGTSTPAAVAAVAAPSDTPAGVQAAVRVTEQPAAPISSSPGPSAVLLLLSGALGLIGLIAVLWIIRRRPS